MGRQMTFGVIVGNRGFFPSHLAASGRTEMIAALERQGHKAIVTSAEQTAFGAVETYKEAMICAELFRQNAREIDGIIITLPNFGEERGIADAIRLANLQVPILIQATPDDAGKMSIAFRRDSFCGKMSICNNLRQYGIPYTLTSLHTEAPDSEEFARDLATFAATCRVVRGFRNLRIGAIGARPAAFNTVRYSEKLLEKSGITVDTLDLSEVFGRIRRLADDDGAVKEKLQAIKSYLPVNNTPEDALLKMAKLGVVIDGWMQGNALDVTSVQCWTSMEEFFGVVPCTVMSMMSEKLLPSACEVDTMGTLSMHALSLASETPSALLDWNNNYGGDPDKAVCFHCSNLPKHFFREGVKMDFQQIIAGTVGKENTFGTLDGRVKSGPMTFARFSTDEFAGTIRGYVGQGSFTDDPLTTFGGAGVVEIEHMQQLLRYICENGFEHHVAANFSHVGEGVKEAAEKYLRWPMHLHH
ncbi:L-fucose/L-arabinose isomerase family protein [Edaphobacter aggregans]|uniref:L-fucose/L-arabinose isomerase family protein n=1 Tax=Edaphobacter aggregans TaxID=570835 RepID=UPI000558DF17|nr:L-fucose/L-arabinose isomerase family protein [Edaphobacter aggregans]